MSAFVEGEEVVHLIVTSPFAAPATKSFNSSSLVPVFSSSKVRSFFVPFRCLLCCCGVLLKCHLCLFSVELHFTKFSRFCNRASPIV